MTTELSLPIRRTHRVRHELRRREVTVAHTERIGTHFASITFAGDALADFASDSFDDHIKFFFQGPSGEVVSRDYTPRSFDPARRLLTIEFALHGDGLACEWARQATPGQWASIGGPRSSLVIPLDYDWHLLAGDSAALPAIHRRVEELPAGARAIVIVQGDQAADERRFASAAELDVRWVRTADQMVSAIRSLQLPLGDGFAWCAGEAATVKPIRDILLVDKGHPRESTRVAAYWKRGASSHHENLD